jgi:hypothetical protein
MPRGESVTSADVAAEADLAEREGLIHPLRGLTPLGRRYGVAASCANARRWLVEPEISCFEGSNASR